MEIVYKRHLNEASDRKPSPLNFTDELDNNGGEPLEGSGFENEAPEADDEEKQ